MHTQLLDIARQRLLHQRLIPPPLERPANVVQWLGAVGAKWALGLRLYGAVDSTVEQACTDGSILRTHLLRPTWHFVTPADIRWMLALTAPRVLATPARLPTLPTPVPTVQPSPLPVMTAVVGTEGDVRAGETVTLLHRTPDGAWFELRNAHGLVGWTHRSLLTLDATAAQQLAIQR